MEIHMFSFDSLSAIWLSMFLVLLVRFLMRNFVNYREIIFDCGCLISY
ncbi:hypothetical protein IHE45_12G016200 [Dioscorea alata]|uniref:Uncharacterized protein n=2 Tax=Dioscorea alata TaxID=55571 RepID=A0ACB7V0L3_DIOAL|nr:hypothetical protein IHE45_12G016100 [Dioscorea alata]KAH7666743.1 hypothetical protein IHE45_12G016200 [Dioscorea alata]